MTGSPTRPSATRTPWRSAAGKVIRDDDAALVLLPVGDGLLVAKKEWAAEPARTQPLGGEGGGPSALSR